jgi:hypothetical protein
MVITAVVAALALVVLPGLVYWANSHPAGRKPKPQQRPHRRRQFRPAQPDHPVADLSQERVKRRPVLGDLINEYERTA